jgi:hypothetical protein
MIVLEGSFAVLVNRFVDTGVEGAFATEVPSLVSPDAVTARDVDGKFGVVGAFKVDGVFGVFGPFGIIDAFDVVHAFVAVGTCNGTDK